MAKFIELPYGEFNPETQRTERVSMLVNTERIISVKPFQQFMCLVTLAGGKQMSVYRKYDTLKAQITGRADLMECYPEEEVAAAFESGYDKCKKESASKGKDGLAPIVKAMTAFAREWFEHNPLSLGWQSKFRKEMQAYGKKLATDPTIASIQNAQEAAKGMSEIEGDDTAAEVDTY